MERVTQEVCLLDEDDCSQGEGVAHQAGRGLQVDIPMHLVVVVDWVVGVVDRAWLQAAVVVDRAWLQAAVVDRVCHLLVAEEGRQGWMGIHLCGVKENLTQLSSLHEIYFNFWFRKMGEMRNHRFPTLASQSKVRLRYGIFFSSFK